MTFKRSGILHPAFDAAAGDIDQLLADFIENAKAGYSQTGIDT